MKVTIQLTTKDVQKLVCDEIEKRVGQMHFRPELVTIKVKTKQNFRAEWESGEFLVSYEGELQ